MIVKRLDFVAIRLTDGEDGPARRAQRQRKFVLATPRMRPYAETSWARITNGNLPRAHLLSDVVGWHGSVELTEKR